MSVFPYFSTFFQKRSLQKVFTAYGSPIFQIKTDEMFFSIQEEFMDIGPKFGGKFEGIWGNPGEIPHI